MRILAFEEITELDSLMIETNCGLCPLYHILSWSGTSFKNKRVMRLALKWWNKSAIIKIIVVQLLPNIYLGMESIQQ